MVVRWRILSLMTDVIEATSPKGEPSKVALAVSSSRAPGIADRMGLVVAGLVQITSDFSWLIFSFLELIFASILIYLFKLELHMNSHFCLF